MVTKADLLLELARKKDTKQSLAVFAENFLEYMPAKHHRLICQYIDALLNDEFDELIINTPPGAAKSTYTSIALPAYFLGRWPHKMVLTASYSTELAEKWGRRVRNMVDTRLFHATYNVGLSKDSKSAGRWATDRGGEFYAAGVGSGILGFRADLACIDDPVAGFEEANSLTQLQKLHDWYETDFVTRLKPNAKVVLICQRLAKNDLAGYLIERNRENPTRRQRILKLTMEAVHDDPADDPLGRAKGERLWPEWYTPEMVTDAKRDDFKWKTLYQQEPPSDDGSWVTATEVKIVDPPEVPAKLHHYLLTDLALSVNSGDYSVHLVAGVDDQGDAYVVDAWRDRCDPNVTASKHLALTTLYAPQESLIDDDNAAKVYVQLLATKAREDGVAVPWKMLPMRGQDKETRAAPLRGMFKRGKIFLKRAEWNRWLVRELLSFPNAMGEGVDDGVDALSLLGRRLASLARPAAPTPPPKPLKTIQEATLNELWEQRELKTGTRSRV